MIKGYFGLPGSGKTTFLTMIAQRENVENYAKAIAEGIIKEIKDELDGR